jgi:hypothetical protein
LREFFPLMGSCGTEADFGLAAAVPSTRPGKRKGITLPGEEPCVLFVAFRLPGYTLQDFDAALGRHGLGQPVPVVELIVVIEAVSQRAKVRRLDDVTMVVVKRTE